MTTLDPGPPVEAARAAEAEAERVMARFRVQQQLQASRVRHDGVVARVFVIAALALTGAFAGGVMGMVRGHAVAGALLTGLVGGLLAAIQTRAR